MCTAGCYSLSFFCQELALEGGLNLSGGSHAFNFCVFSNCDHSLNHRILLSVTVGKVAQELCTSAMEWGIIRI